MSFFTDMRSGTAGKASRRIGALCATLAALSLSGCGSDSGVIPTQTGTYFGPTIPLGAGTTRSFVTLNDGVPQEVGIEFDEGALNGQPAGAPDITVPFAVPLPAEADRTPFVALFGVYSSGHVPPHTGVTEPAHFHPVFLLNQPVQPPDPARADAPVAAAEIPANHIRTGEIVPLLGSIYDDPSLPAGVPPPSTLGTGIFFYDGHLNGYQLGETLQFLGSRANASGIIEQPQVYPKAGYYPTRYTIRYDAARGTHQVVLQGFERATRTL